MRVLGHSLKFSFPGFVFLMRRGPVVPDDSTRILLRTVPFVQGILQRIMPSGAVHGDPSPMRMD